VALPITGHAASFHAYAGQMASPVAVLGTMNERAANLMEADHFLTVLYGVVEQPGVSG
jgi:hypothetical protein